jgi:IclR family transcriptional regulator, pca regulon regulatory protein
VAPRQPDPPDGEFVRTLDRGLAVIRAFGPATPQLTLSEVAARTGISRAAARRLLLTLERLGYVATDDGRRFALRPAILDLGYAYLSSLRWWQEAQVLIGPLAGRLGVPCAVGVLDGADVIYVAYAAPGAMPEMGRAIGTRLPASATAIGRVLLAGLPPENAAAVLRDTPPQPLTPLTVTDPVRLAAILDDVRRRDSCLVDQELRLGLRSLGVPIRDVAGRMRAAISASFGVVEPADPLALLPSLAEVAAAIGRVP